MSTCLFLAFYLDLPQKLREGNQFSWIMYCVCMHVHAREGKLMLGVCNHIHMLVLAYMFKGFYRYKCWESTVRELYFWLRHWVLILPLPLIACVTLGKSQLLWTKVASFVESDIWIRGPPRSLSALNLWSLQVCNTLHRWVYRMRGGKAKTQTDIH